MEDREIGANVTEDDRDLYLKQNAVFRRWFDREVIGPGEDEHQQTIMVLPYGDAESRYRNDPREYAQSLAAHICSHCILSNHNSKILTYYREPLPLEGINPTLLSPILGTPHMIVPSRSDRMGYM